VTDFLSEEELALFNSAPTEEQSKKLTNLGRELMELTLELDSLNERVQAKSRRVLEITQRELPAYMQEIGQDRVGLAEHGVDLVLTPFYNANIKADWDDERRQRGFDHLEKRGHGDLVKVTVTYTFGRGELELARRLTEIVRRASNEMPEPETKTAVHPQTLTAFWREQVENGNPDEIDAELIGASSGLVVKIKKRKK